MANAFLSQHDFFVLVHRSSRSRPRRKTARLILLYLGAILYYYTTILHYSPIIRIPSIPVISRGPATQRYQWSLECLVGN